jgi:hypothetical protein
MKLIQMADSIHKLQDKLRNLEGEVLDISKRKSVSREKLEGRHYSIWHFKPLLPDPQCQHQQHVPEIKKKLPSTLLL